jgi:hypothetical protein
VSNSVGFSIFGILVLRMRSSLAGSPCTCVGAGCAVLVETARSTERALKTAEREFMDWPRRVMKLSGPIKLPPN